ARRRSPGRRRPCAPGRPEPPIPTAAERRWRLPAAIGGGVAVLAIMLALVFGRSGTRTSDVNTTATSAPTTSAQPRTDRPTPASSSPAASADTRPTEPPTKTPAVVSTSRNAATGPAAAATTLRVTSEPAGAAITLDGRDTRQVTPASIAINGAGPHRLRVAKRGFKTLDARLTATELQSGGVSYTLTEAE